MLGSLVMYTVYTNKFTFGQLKVIDWAIKKTGHDIEFKCAEQNDGVMGVRVAAGFLSILAGLFRVSLSYP